MSEYTLLVGVHEYAVLKENVEVNLQANWQGTIAVDIDLDNDATRIAARSEFTLKKDGVDWLGGVITQTPERGLGGPNLEKIVHHIAGVGYETYLTYRYVTETIPAGTTLKAALQILDDYLPTGVTLDPAQVTGPSLSQDFPFVRTRLDEALKALTGDTGYLPEIDPDKLFRMVSPASNPAPFDILDSGPTEVGGLLYQIGDLVVERTLDDNYANRIIGEVRGSGPATSTEVFGPSDYTTVGGFRYFTAKYPASISINDMWPNVLLFDGVVQGPIGRVVSSPQSWDVPTNAWDWDMTVSPARLRYTIASGADFPTTEDIQITYAIAFPFYVQGNDLTDQASHPIKEALVTIDESMSLVAAQAFVDAEATKRSATIERVRYTTEHSTLRPGMSQTITVAARGINASCLITEVRGYCPSERPGSEWLFDITAIVGAIEQGNVRQTYKDWLKQGGAGPARTGTAGTSVAPPLLSGQYNNNGVFGGSEKFLVDPNSEGDNYGVTNIPSVLAVTTDDNRHHIALVNSTNGAADAFTVRMIDGGDTLIEQDGGNDVHIDVYGGGAINLSGTSARVQGGEPSVAGTHLRLGDLIALDSAFPGVQRKTTSFTVDSAWSGGGQPEHVVILDSSTARTVTLNAVTGDTTSLGVTDSWGRQITFININTAAWALTPSSGTIEGLSSWPVMPGARVTIQAYAGTGAGWFVVSSYQKPAVLTLTDAQIKALPTTPISTFVPAPSSGFRHKLLGLSWRSSFVAAYTNINATYAAAAVYYLGSFNQWAATGIVDDSSVPITNFSGFFGAINSSLVDSTVYLDALGNGWTTANINNVSNADGVALAVAMDNNGSGNLTGGNASNTLKITAYYTVEAV